jgi:hypothetical protein
MEGEGVEELLEKEAENEWLREQLKIIADWDKVPLSGEWRESLLDIIRCICDRARRAIAAEKVGDAYIKPPLTKGHKMEEEVKVRVRTSDYEWFDVTIKNSEATSVTRSQLVWSCGVNRGMSKMLSERVKKIITTAKKGVNNG